MTPGSLAIDTVQSSDDEIIFVVRSTDAGRRAACEAVRALAPARTVGRLRPERVIHATLVLAGPASDPRVVPVAEETAGLIRLPPFELVFDTLTGFGGPKGALALTCSAIPPEWAPLRRQLSQIPRRLGLPVEGGGTPHLTMGYGFDALPAIRLTEPVVWAVDGFRLIHSRHGETDHINLAEWAL